jgi:hypothetical protein
MQIGSIKQEANWFMKSFVFGCSMIIILLLHVMVKAEQKALSIDSVSMYSDSF